nr:putative ATP-dependent RNA helicase TDRD12 [Bactrocera oleae]
MSSEKDKHVSVTHFINPQLFWFHSISVPNPAYHEIKELEEQLEQYYQTHQPWTQAIHKPAVDMLVAVKFLSWHKMIRARVEHIANFSKNTQGGEYIMWAIDYGFPFQTKSEQIFRLPDKLSRPVAHIQRGGLAYLTPAEKDFDFRMNSAVTNAKENWSQRACELVDKLLNESESVVFVEKFRHDVHFWGDLIVTTHVGYKCNVRDYLIGISLALDVGPNFREACVNLKATKILPWMTNSGNSKFSANKGFLCEGLGRDNKKIQQLVSTELDDYAKKKVEDWCARNEIAILQEIADFEDDILLDSVKFDDSVSNKDYEVGTLNNVETVELTKENKKCIEFEKLPSDNESDNSLGNCEITEQQLGLAGTLSKSLEEKYGKQQLPPKPKSTDFDVCADAEKEAFKENVPHDKEKLLSGVESLASTRSGVSRKQKLLEKRKQINNKQTDESIITDKLQELTLKPEINKNNLIELISNASTTAESDIKKHTRETITENSESSSINASVVSTNVTNTRAKRHLLNRQRASMKQEESTTDSTSTNELTPQTTSVSSKRMEYLRKQRLEKLKAENNENPKQESSAEEPTSKSQDQAPLKKLVEKSAAPTAPAKSSAHIGRLLNLRKKIQDVKPDSYFALTNNRSRPTTETLKESNTFHGLRMIPAGFDITNLNHYKDEKNHWHRKATTRFDHVPHDANVVAMEMKMTREYKLPDSAGSKAVETAASTTKQDNILDTTVPELSEDPIDFSITSEAKSKESTTPEELSPYSSSSSPAPKKYGRYRSLKSPATQMNKIDEILRSAYNEKAGGNSEILDLDNVNASACKDDSDNTELYSADDGTNGTTTTDNDDMDLEHNSTSNKRSLIRNRLLKKLAAQQEHLKQIEDKLTNELNTTKPEIFRIHLPEVKELRAVEGEHKLKTKFIDHLVLAHSNVPLTALTRISEAFFLKEIHDEMENMRVTKLYRIQAYAWPHLLRGNSMFVVNPHKSGKTWSYLPAICSLVAYRIQSCRIAETYGPVAIILLPTSAHVEIVHNYCKRLLLGVRPAVTTVASYGVRNANDAKIQLLNSCGILVATPASLLRLLRDNEQEPLIDMERLKHLVIDDLDLMLSRSQNDIELVLKTLFKLSKRGKDSAMAWQLVVTSRDWDSLLVALMRKSNQPLLLIGDFLEAAVYGRVMISIKLCPSERKITTVLEFIEQNSLENERILVLCNSDDDVYEVVDGLTTSAHVCIAYDNHASADVRTIIEEWRKKKVMSSRILVCADSSFPELQIQNVSHVIHYSMPTSWTKFTARFSALAQTYDNYVSKNFEIPTGVDRPTARSLILLDEENSIQLPRLMDFMKKHDQLKFIHADILAVSKRVLVEREEARILHGARMCPFVLEFGECDEARCEFRHNLTRFDAVVKKDRIPTNGDMRILILKVFSPTHYAARLLQQRTANSNKWQDVRRSPEVCNFSMQLNLHYLKQENWNLLWPLHIGDLCVYKYAETYQRARILELPDVSNTAIIKAIKLTLKLIDEGSIISSVKSDELYVCADKFKDFPAQAINIRLTGVVPFDNERTWDTKATKTVQQWIMSDIKKNECVHVSINFTLIDTIWVNNVIVMEQLEQVGQYVYRVNLKRSLMEKNIADVGDSKRQGIREIAEELGLLAYSDEADTLSDSESEFKSFSENDTSNLMKFSSNDDTAESEKLQQVQRQAANTQEVAESNSLIQIGDENVNDDVEDWDAQLNDNANNAKEIYLPLQTTIKIEEDEASTITTLPTTENDKLISTDILTSINGKEAWLELPLEQMVKVEIGSEDENGNWSDIYLQHIDSEQLDKFDELLLLINKHIAKLKRKPAMPFPASWFKPMQNCIIHHDNRYLRAKLYGIFSNKAPANAAPSTIYRFFLCDYACFVMAKSDELYKDFLYPTTKEILEFTPYQAIHCRLAGINFNKFAKRYKITKDYLFAYAVKASGCALTSTIADFNINSYEILLYENETEDNLQTIELFNNKLIENGVATANESAKEVFQKRIAAPKAPKDLCNFDELLQCIQRSFELELCEFADTSTKSPLLAIEPPIQAATESIEKLPERTNKPLAYKPLKSKFTPNSSGNEEEPPLSSNKTSSISDNCSATLNSTSTALDTTSSSTNSLTPPPALKANHKRPQLSWYDTDCFIYLVIHAPDVVDYYLEVTSDTLIFSANIQDVPHALVLNLLGLVEPSLVSHEIRGLNVLVRLVKGVFMKWPRLLQQTLRYTWLTYNLNAIDLAEVEKLLPQQQLEMILQKTAALNHNDGYSSDDESDDERNLFQTYTPIVNSEDLCDPTVELF